MGRPDAARNAFIRELGELAVLCGVRRNDGAGLMRALGPGEPDTWFYDFVQKVLKSDDTVFLTVVEAVRFSRTSESTVLRHIKDGKLRAYRFAGRTLISTASFMQMFRDWEPPAVTDEAEYVPPAADVGGGEGE